MFNSDLEAAIWEDMLDRYGEEGMARRIAKSPAYKEYRKAFPEEGLHYGKVEVISIDHLGYELESTAEDLISSMIADETVEEFLTTLTPKQRFVIEKYLAGFLTSEIAKAGNYRSDGWSAYSGVRYHRAAARRKYKRFKDEA